MSKKRIQSLHLSDGSFVLGEVIDVSPSAVILRQPLVVRKHPALPAVYLVKYQPFGEVTNSEFVFLTNSIISYAVPDKDTIKLYKAGVKGLREAEKTDRKLLKNSGDDKYTIFRPGDTQTNNQLESVENEPSLDELRRTTVRADD